LSKFLFPTSAENWEFLAQNICRVCYFIYFIQCKYEAESCLFFVGFGSFCFSPFRRLKLWALSRRWNLRVLGKLFSCFRRRPLFTFYNFHSLCRPIRNKYKNTKNTFANWKIKERSRNYLERLLIKNNESWKQSFEKKIANFFTLCNFWKL